MDKPLFITSDKEYRHKLKTVENLVALNPEPKSLEGIRLKHLASQVEMYEKLHFDCGQKLIKARKIREEIWPTIRENGLFFDTTNISSLKAQLTKIIKRNL